MKQKKFVRVKLEILTSESNLKKIMQFIDTLLIRDGGEKGVG